MSKETGVIYSQRKMLLLMNNNNNYWEIKNLKSRENEWKCIKKLCKPNLYTIDIDHVCEYRLHIHMKILTTK